jgi:hypothetical protein
MVSDFDQLFEAVAQMRDLAVANREQLDKNVETAQAARDWLLQQSEVSAEDRERYLDASQILFSTVRTQLENCMKELEGGGKILTFIEPELPEHVGILTAQAESVEALAANLKAQAACLSLIHEVQRRLG